MLENIKGGMLLECARQKNAIGLASTARIRLVRVFKFICSWRFLHQFALAALVALLAVAAVHAAAAIALKLECEFRSSWQTSL